METEALTGRKVFVTGATGFIGRRLVTSLLDTGAEVTVLLRSRAGAKDLPDGVRTVIADMADGTALTQHLTEQDILFNLAYDVRASASTNLASFDTLLASAAAAGIGRIVHTSSIVVYDGWPNDDLTEGSSMDLPGGSPYRQAKIAMEKRLLAAPMAAAILQPTIVYGPGSSLWTDGFATALAEGGVVLPTPEGVCNGVFVDDVVQACLRAATLPDLGRERFIISGPDTFPWSALLQGYAAIMGQGEVKHVPVAELTAGLGPKPQEGATDAGPSLAARISSVARKLIGHKRFEALVRSIKSRLSKGGMLMPNHHLLEEYCGKGLCRIDHAKSRLGYAPAFDLERGLDASADHLKKLLR
ncbi:MAG: NAD-dependent epimerase/dehydratase family protein [Albidovulum sp.]